jgi:predicted RNA-binding protein associated with RNAse of E/G family
MANSLRVIASGDWQRDFHMRDYRAEWLNDMLVERAAWVAAASPQSIGRVQVTGPNFVWFRFWLGDGEQILDKYFDASGLPIGMYSHVGMALPHQGRNFSLVDLILGLWITADARVTVHHEAAFDEAVRAQVITPIEAEHAEHQIREMTMAIAQKRFPPALVRNFSIVAVPR